MIRAEDVADIQHGDVVRITGWYGVTIEGPVWESMGSLWLGQHCRVTSHAGEPAAWMHMDADAATLTVIARAPRPLYVNSDRTEPAPGDVVTYPDRHIEGIGPWFAHRQRDGGDIFWMSPTGPVLGEMPFPMRLLVDGSTGQVVPS